MGNVRLGLAMTWALAWTATWALLAIAGSPAAAQAGGTVVDAGGRSVSVSDASRILCIGGDVTEIAYALGAGDRVTAVDTTSQYPPQALQEKKSVGYMRALSSEGVMSRRRRVTISQLTPGVRATSSLSCGPESISSPAGAVSLLRGVGFIMYILGRFLDGLPSCRAGAPRIGSR